MFAQLHYWAALPEIVILAAASLILLVDLFVPDDRRYISYWLTQLTLLTAVCVTLTTLRLDSIKGYNGLIVDDMLADFLRIACFIAVSLIMAVVKICALLTIRKQQWLTRQVAVIDGQVQRTGGAPA